MLRRVQDAGVHMGTCAEVRRGTHLVYAQGVCMGTCAGLLMETCAEVRIRRGLHVQEYTKGVMRRRTCAGAHMGTCAEVRMRRGTHLVYVQGVCMGTCAVLLMGTCAEVRIRSGTHGHMRRGTHGEGVTQGNTWGVELMGRGKGRRVGLCSSTVEAL